jgi:hypothetical protein
MALEPARAEGGVDTTGSMVGVVVGVPAADAAVAVMAAFRPLFDGTNAALVLMIVVVRWPRSAPGRRCRHGAGRRCVVRLLSH